MAFADFFGILVALLAGYMLSKKMLQPIDKMTKVADEIGLYGLSTRIDIPPAEDELSRLGRTFNAMLDRLNTAFEKQGRFVADASHELRTPVSIIQGYIEMMDRWGKQDPKITQEAIDAIKKETLNMTKIIEALLFLARGDQESQLLQKSWFDMDELIEELSNESGMLSPDHHFSFNSSHGQSFFADRRLIKQMLRAILDNSIKFTPAGGKIDFLYEKDEKNIIITITDTGIGIPASEKEFVFDRFYRVDKARARVSGGNGLGLSIAKWIVDAHDGEISIESTIDKGTSFRIALPFLPKH